MKKCFRLLILTAFMLVGLLSCEGEQESGAANTRPVLDPALVQNGMLVEEVSMVFGIPDRIVRDDKNDMEAWTYYESETNISPGTQIGGLTIIFRTGLVEVVLPIMVRKN